MFNFEKKKYFIFLLETKQKKIKKLSKNNKKMLIFCF